MTAPQDLAATHSHLYPGARGTAGAPLGDGPVSLTFADGTRVAGRLTGDRLTIDAHRTAKGTSIPLKTWVIARGATDPDGRMHFVVRARDGGVDSLR
ncbi:hypothetical protein N8I71_19620 [Roseibacterium sp. SDUM158016]|uniref:hypothetical protein n=1 Tax=Roseicyclus sediminis TaxID=2980997 RepID=UPI0021CF2F43|nr:hypothetical protein [Roseibacterium sp. SDUM158016]MCU4655056.1 hypothetical protein [Roseibacterium sp. SDUM158016]